MNTNSISIRVWGDLACFTRPEMKVERVSYPIITPSAARGILESIFWEPQIYYVIDSIRVVQRGVWISFKRNEVQDRLSLRNAQSWMFDQNQVSYIMAGAGENTSATPRNTLALERVEYIITAEIHLSDIGKKTNLPLTKYYKEVQNRAQKGKCFYRPCLGVREFAADFDWEEDPDAALDRRHIELGVSEKWKDDLGLILYDVFDYEDRSKGFRWLTDAELAEVSTKSSTPPSNKKTTNSNQLTRFEGKAATPSASFFRAYIRDSKLDCHPSRISLIRRQGAI